MSLDKYDEENSSELTHSVLLLVEGKADASFLMHLAGQRGIGPFHYGFPTDTTGGFGKDAFGKYLANLPARTGFNKLKAIIVLYDNDSDPAAAFTTISGLVDATDPYTIPGAPSVLGVAEPNKVRLMFAPMPSADVVGALESLLLQSTATNSAEAIACIDALTVCAHCDGWPASHDAKMRLRCLISTKCQGNSDITLTHVWGKPGNPIDLTHACFDALVATFLDVLATV